MEISFRQILDHSRSDASKKVPLHQDYMPVHADRLPRNYLNTTLMLSTDSILFSI